MSNWLNKTFQNIDYNSAKFFHIIETKCSSASTHFMEFISFLGKSGIIMIIIGIILCLFAKTRKCGLCILFSLAISAIITSVLIKPIVARARPYSNINSDFYIWWQNAGKHLEDSFSFPSGHSTAAMAFAMSIFATSKKKKISWLIFFFPALMASSRMYLMVHYFSDCLFGFIVGAVTAFIVALLLNLIYKKAKGKLKYLLYDFDIRNFKK